MPLPSCCIQVATAWLLWIFWVKVDDLYSMSPKGEYWYRNGYNRRAIAALVPAALVPMLCVFIPAWRPAANYAWFIGMGLGFAFYALLNAKR